MARDDVDGFRITPWPGVVVPIPPVTKTELRLNGNYVTERGGPTWKEPLADELAIRGLLDVNLQEAADVVAFLQAHGVILRTAQESELNIDITEPERPPGAEGVYWPHIAAHLWQAQVLASHVLAHLDGQEVFPVWERFGVFGGGPTNRRNAKARRTNENMAWGEFQGMLNSGLRWYHARVELRFDPFPGERPPLEVPGFGQIGLYSALCLQILNILTEGLPAHRCANERCCRRFIRQQGRSEHGQYRKIGVEFCSVNCAKAQTQRNYRHRLAEGTR